MNSEKQFDLAQSEFKLIQQQIDKYDALLSQIKTWTITIWAASIGWAFQTKTKETFLLSIFIVLAFWFLDGFNKNFRQDYKKRRNRISEALKTYYQTDNLPENFVAPDLPKHHMKEAVKCLFQPHVFLLYLSLVIISLFLYLFVI